MVVCCRTTGAAGAGERVGVGGGICVSGDRPGRRCGKRDVGLGFELSEEVEEGAAGDREVCCLWVLALVLVGIWSGG